MYIIIHIYTYISFIIPTASTSLMNITTYYKISCRAANAKTTPNQEKQRDNHDDGKRDDTRAQTTTRNHKKTAKDSANQRTACEHLNGTRARTRENSKPLYP